MIDQLPIHRHQYCGSDGLSLGWQHGKGIITFKKRGIPGSRMCCLICRRSGAVLFRWIAGQHRFSRSGRSHKSCDANQR